MSKKRYFAENCKDSRWAICFGEDVAGIQMGATRYLTLNVEKCSKAAKSPGVSKCASTTRIERFLESAQLRAYSKSAKSSQLLLSTLLTSTDALKSQAFLRKHVFGDDKDNRYEIENGLGLIPTNV